MQRCTLPRQPWLRGRGCFGHPLPPKETRATCEKENAGLEFRSMTWAYGGFSPGECPDHGHPPHQQPSFPVEEGLGLCLLISSPGALSCWSEDPSLALTWTLTQLCRDSPHHHPALVLGPAEQELNTPGLARHLDLWGRMSASCLSDPAQLLTALAALPKKSAAWLCSWEDAAQMAVAGL